MSDVNFEELEDRIAAEIDAGLKEGFKLGPFFFNMNGQCCALGMVCRNEGGLMEGAARKLGIGLHEALSIAYGFDNGITVDNDDPYRAVGVRLHKRYNQTPAI